MKSVNKMHQAPAVYILKNDDMYEIIYNLYLIEFRTENENFLFHILNVHDTLFLIVIMKKNKQSMNFRDNC